MPLLLRRTSLTLYYIGEMFRVATVLAPLKHFLAGDSALLCLTSSRIYPITGLLFLLIFALAIVMT